MPTAESAGTARAGLDTRRGQRARTRTKWDLGPGGQNQLRGQGVEEVGVEGWGRSGRRTGDGVKDWGGEGEAEAPVANPRPLRAPLGPAELDVVVVGSSQVPGLGR